MVNTREAALQFQNQEQELGFLGLNIFKSKAEREAIAKEKADKAAQKAANKQAKADAKLALKKARSESMVELAKKGVDSSFWGNFGKGLSGILEQAGGILGSQTGGGLLGGLGGSGNSGIGGGVDYEDLPPQEPKDNTIIWVVGGVIFTVLVGVVIWAVNKNK